MEKLIVANWKMNKTVSETADFLKELKKTNIPKGTLVCICPPFTALSEASKILNKTRISLGCQNIYFEDRGAFTAEISPLMIKELNCLYVIIGHSERRKIFNETDELINKKIKSALLHKLIPIFCVGETKEERAGSKTEEVIKKQIEEGLKKITDMSKIVIAYEPVWAIGTGVNATPEQAEEVHNFIRKLIAQLYNKDVAKKIFILYGGSVTPENIPSLLSKNNINGALIGGASLDIEKFKEMIKTE